MTNIDLHESVGLLKLLGIRTEEATPDRVVLSMEVTEDHLQPAGILHGGIHCTLIETAASVGGHLWQSAQPDGGSVAGVANQTDFLRPVKAGTTLAVLAEPVHRGRSQQLWRVEVTGPDGRAVAVGQVRLHNFAGKPA